MNTLHFEDESCRPGKTLKFQMIVDRFNKIAGTIEEELHLSIDEGSIIRKSGI